MRTLPPVPNLEHLKQQAKDLLTSLREDDARASLSDAQRMLAEQFGFRAWTDLKAEVERIRSKPELFDPDVVARVAKAFDLGDLSEPLVLISSLGVGGPSVKLRTASGTWHAKAWYPPFEAGAAEDTVRLMDAMRAEGVMVPVAVRSPSGSLAEEIGDHYWRVDGWIDVGPTIAAPVSRTFAFKAGGLVAKMHALNLDPSRGMHPWLAAKPRDAAAWQRIIEILTEKEASWVPALQEALPVILDISGAHVDAPKEGLVLAHTDFQPSTTHAGPSGTLVPLGWDFTGAISRGWHLGMVLDSWCALPNEGINGKAASAIVDGYTSVAELPPIDVSIFSPVITAWLNWLVSRMNVALGENGRAKEHAEREVANMLEHPKDRSRFERLLQAAGVS